MRRALPYWALKTMLVLAMGEDDPFWLAPELPLPPLAAQHSIKHADQVLVHQTDHLWMLTSGQLERNNFVNTESEILQVCLLHALRIHD
ncbi:Uncharacterized protein conserved in bacteria [Raoultella planticola]|uniref:Uncharacterized protein conserved in bacteria n=1 Tax=Raoultella planticola TaxID=575 RepID=A0A485BP05_RAOPL|nr:Uncharacterized protein conserved in bacteria [Raoultella planticola]